MAFDDALAERIRGVLDARSDVDERKMFGGIAFLVAGNMACGVTRDDLMVRMDPADAGKLESEPGARRFAMGGRPMNGWLLVAPEATADEGDLERWVRRGETFAASLPPKSLPASASTRRQAQHVGQPEGARCVEPRVLAVP